MGGEEVSQRRGGMGRSWMQEVGDVRWEVCPESQTENSRVLETSPVKREVWEREGNDAPQSLIIPSES